MVPKRIDDAADDLNDELMTVPGLAHFLVKPEATLYQWRYRGEGPPSIKVGRHIRYRRSDVEAWLDSRRGADPRRPSGEK